MPVVVVAGFFFFFNDTATTEIYPLSLHDALPISWPTIAGHGSPYNDTRSSAAPDRKSTRSELQSRLHLVCRLLLETKKKQRHHLKRRGSHATQQSAPARVWH